MLANLNDNSLSLGEGELQAAQLHNALRFLLLALEAYDAMPTEQWWREVHFARDLARKTMTSIGVGD